MHAGPKYPDALTLKAAEERQLVERAAQDYGVSRSAVVRECIRRAAPLLYPPRTPLTVEALRAANTEGPPAPER